MTVPVIQEFIRSWVISHELERGIAPGRGPDGDHDDAVDAHKPGIGPTGRVRMKEDCGHDLRVPSPSSGDVGILHPRLPHGRTRACQRTKSSDRNTSGDFFTPPVIVGPYHRSKFVTPQIQGEFLGVQIQVVNNPPKEVTIHLITC